MFDIDNFISQEENHSRYKRRIDFLLENNLYIESIEKAVASAVENIFEHKTRAFVIYGEPQSGKTEMMIALTARLLDEGFKIIIVLLNDNITLLNQNLERFRRSDIDPAPKNFTEILDPSVNIGNSEWIIFCKKNSKNLQQLISKLDNFQEKIIIDDEADYATPNSKINKNEKNKINELIEKLLGEKGTYIGVTATPARLDLNYTFENENDKWIDFSPHTFYTGQDVFFPMNYEELSSLSYNLDLLPDENDDPKYLREALFNFFINVARINLLAIKENKEEENYCMIIHTSGKNVDQANDYRETIKVLNILKDRDNKYFESYFKKIWEMSEKKYLGEEDNITKYIIKNISRNLPVVINSDKDISTGYYESATNPATLFTIAIGGNIISRGVTFKNLLSMFFTRDVKHKIQQDTYIQRARMFGSRQKYLPYFSLHIPKNSF